MGLCDTLQGASFEEIVSHAGYISRDLDELCNTLLASSQNVAIYELYFKKLFNWPYASIVATPWSQKKALIDEFIVNYCSKSIYEDGASDLDNIYNRNYSNIVSLISGISFLKDILRDADNVVFTEYLLRSLGLPYDDLLRANISSKQLELSSLLAFNPTLASRSFTLPAEVSFPTTTATYVVAHGGAGGEVFEPVVSAEPSWVNSISTGCIETGGFPGGLPFVGTRFCLLDKLYLNEVFLSNYPVVGKYLSGAGYPMASMSVVIKNNLIGDQLLNLVPDNILALIPAGYQTDFYTEILKWDPSFTYNPNGIDFSAKDNMLNLVFHGTMMDWFASEYNNFNFYTGSASKNLDIGVFNTNGIGSTFKMGYNGLELINVHAHDASYSPDNAILIVQRDRNIISWWSVAKSDVLKRAIITYHVLINQQRYPDFVANLDSISSGSVYLADLMTGLNGLPNVGGADGAAWQQAMEFLSRLYSV